MNNTTTNDHLDVLQNIEAGLKQQYEVDHSLTDQVCAFALESAKIAVKHHFGFAPNENVSSRPELQGVIHWCVMLGEERVGKVNDLTLKEYVALIEKVRRSVVRHSEDGSRAYFEFIKRFVP